MARSGRGGMGPRWREPIGDDLDGHGPSRHGKFWFVSAWFAQGVRWGDSVGHDWSLALHGQARHGEFRLAWVGAPERA